MNCNVFLRNVMEASNCVNTQLTKRNDSFLVGSQV